LLVGVVAAVQQARALVLVAAVRVVY